MPDSRAPSARRADPAGQVLVCVLLAALATAIIQAPGWGWLSWRTAALLAVAAGALAGLGRLEPRRADPLIQLSLFRSARFTAADRLRRLRDRRAGRRSGSCRPCTCRTCGACPRCGAGLTIGPMAAEMAVCAPLAGR